MLMEYQALCMADVDGRGQLYTAVDENRSICPKQFSQHGVWLESNARASRFQSHLVDKKYNQAGLYLHFLFLFTGVLFALLYNSCPSSFLISCLLVQPLNPQVTTSLASC